MDAQELVGETERAPVGERDLEHARRLVELDLGGSGGRGVEAGHRAVAESSRERTSLAQRQSVVRAAVGTPCLPATSDDAGFPLRGKDGYTGPCWPSGTMSRLPMP